MIGALKKKYNRESGFTLIELLIVVAIIAILVAISIPLITSNLDKAKESTDAANVRAAKAVAVLDKVEGSLPEGNTWVYDAPAGKLVKLEGNTVTKYGQKEDGDVIYVKFNGNQVQYQWAAPGTTDPAGSWNNA